MAHHLDNRRVNRRMIAQEIGASIVGGEHDRIAIRQVIIQHREALTAPARPRAKPGRDNEAACCCAGSGISANTIGNVTGRLSRGSKNGTGKWDRSLFTASML